MFTFILGVLGWSAFVIGTLALGTWLRRNPSKDSAETTSRILHFLFFAGLVFPGVIGVFYPGLAHFDDLLGISPLPFQPVPLVLGILALLIGLYFSLVSNKALQSLGCGANAFKLTKRVVETDIYTRSRNPMSLGYYLVCIGIGLVAGSTFITLGSLLGIIPAHIFYLKYFEELELELRFGQPYLQYKRSVPFLIPQLSLRAK
jgi:protein-S-isoprenylcysteine O-methyltransferase Ste14